MTQEQYNRAVMISHRIADLERLKRDLYPSTERRLTYVDKEYHPLPEWLMKHISDILDKHDAMIRKEIDFEINTLMEEVEAL